MNKLLGIVYIQPCVRVCVCAYVRCCSILMRCHWTTSAKPWVDSGQPQVNLAHPFDHLITVIGQHYSVISFKTVTGQQNSLYFNTISEELLAATWEKWSVLCGRLT